MINITSTIRTAIINNPHRADVLGEIEDVLGVARIKAKRLLFAFVYGADEEYLHAIATGPEISDGW